MKSVSFSRQGQQLVTASDDKSVKLWNVEGMKFVLSFTGHTNWVRTAKFSPDERLIVSGSDDKSVKLWDIRRKMNVHTFNDHAG